MTYVWILIVTYLYSSDATVTTPWAFTEKADCDNAARYIEVQKRVVAECRAVRFKETP